ncbi:MAG: SRPBCC domain-containing protein [Candidatus Nitrosocosmicus sp.]|nr:SRPBCC domain-containing protein [Candidatus Nitrosocosmicus sp.]MDN5868720.1 SRPBCC domain-containing protein [Candidatus Nitrosocosmicus sp.]
MKEFERTNKNVIQQLSSIEKRSGESPNNTSKGTIAVEGKYGTIKFERRLKHPKELVWKAITDQREIFRWLPDYKGTFDGYKGGTIDLLNVVSGSHVTGNIRVCDLHRVFEHEWFIAPNQMFTHGEPESVIRLELKQNDGSTSDTLLIMTHNCLTKSTALTLAPGWHAYLDRLEAILDNQVPPNWAHRFAEVKELYSS